MIIKTEFEHELGLKLGECMRTRKEQAWGWTKNEFYFFDIKLRLWETNKRGRKNKIKKLIKQKTRKQNAKKF